MDIKFIGLFSGNSFLRKVVRKRIVADPTNVLQLVKLKAESEQI